MNAARFRGSVVALNAVDGSPLWKTYLAPDNGGSAGGYSGNAVWSSPAIDPGRGLLYTDTGNNYTVPDDVTKCVDETFDDSLSCMDPTNFVDSVVALDLTTGEVRWGKALQGVDDFANFEDWDFGAGPNLFTATIEGVSRDLVGAGQKSGVYWALDADTGEVVWRTSVGPGGDNGGIEWGTATDGERIYVAIANSEHTPHILTSGAITESGFWSSLDPATGRILWQTADPRGGTDPGPVSVANGVVYAGSADPEGYMYALDGETGYFRWDFASGGSVLSAPAIVDAVLYWGSGYRRQVQNDRTTGNNKLYAFALSAPPVPG